MMFHKNLIGNKLFLLSVELLKLFCALLLVNLVLVDEPFDSFRLSVKPKGHLSDCIFVPVVVRIIDR